MQFSVGAVTRCPWASPAAVQPRPRHAWRVSALHSAPAGGSIHDSIDLGEETLEAVHTMAESDDVLHHLITSYSMTGHATKKYKKVGDLMQTNLITACPDEALADVQARMAGIEGVPVVDTGGKLVGVVSKKDLSKGGAAVRDVMTATPISCKATDKVTAAAHAMLDNKIHRVPVVDDGGKCVGIVTRTDIFWELASQSDRAEWLEEHGVHV